MANNESLSTIVAVLLDADDDLSIKEIAARCVPLVRPPTIASAMYQMVKRGHALECGKSPKRFSLTSLGRKAIDIIDMAKHRLNRPNKTVDEIVRTALARTSEEVDHSDGKVPFPRAELRLLASAALASAKPLDDKLRAVCLHAIKEAA